MYIVETSSSVFASTGGTVVLRILNAEGGSPITNFWYTLSTGTRPSWETHAKSAETFTVTFDENLETDSRAITYTFYTEVTVDGVTPVDSASVVVTQDGYAVPAAVADIAATKEQQTIEVTIENVTNASVSVDSPWLSFVTAATNTLQLILQLNESAARTANVTLVYANDIITFKVVQAEGTAAGTGTGTGTVIYDDNGNPTENVQIVSLLAHTIPTTGSVITIVPTAGAVLPLSYNGSSVPWIYNLEQADQSIRVVVRLNPDGATLRKGTFTIADAAGMVNVISVEQAAGAVIAGKNYRLFSKRFVLRQEMIDVPVTQTRTILQSMANERVTSDFSLASVARSDLLAPRGDDEGLAEWKIDGYDAYSLCYRHTTTNEVEKHSVLAGAVLYRFDTPWISGTPAIESLKLYVKADGYTQKGAKITLVAVNRDAKQFTRADMLPITTENKVARRRVLGENWYASVEEIQLKSFSFTPSASTTLGVLVELEDYSLIRDSWVEGSCGLNLPVYFNFAAAVTGMEGADNGEIAVDPSTGGGVLAQTGNFAPAMILTNGRVHLTDATATAREFFSLQTEVTSVAVTELAIVPTGTTYSAPNTLSSFNFDVVALPTGETTFAATVSDTNWMSVAVTDTSFTVTLAAQMIGATARSGTVTVTSGTGEALETITLTFNQAAGEAALHLTLSADAETITAIDSTGHTFDLVQKPNGVTEYTVTPTVAWLSVSKANDRVTWTAKKNGMAERVGYLQVVCGTESVNFTVTQSQNATPIDISPRTGIIEPNGGTTTFTALYPEGATVTGVASDPTTTWVSAVLAGSTVTTTSTANEGAVGRIGIVIVSYLYDGAVYTMQYAVRQKAYTEIATNKKLIRLASDGTETDLVATVTADVIDKVAVCGDTCFLSGSFTNLFGETGKTNLVPVGLTANATKTLTENGTAYTFSSAPPVLMKGLMSVPKTDVPAHGDPLYALRMSTSPSLANSTFMYDVSATEIGLGHWEGAGYYWGDNYKVGSTLYEIGGFKMFAGPVGAGLACYFVLRSGNNTIRQCYPSASSTLGEWYSYPTLSNQPYALAMPDDGTYKIYVAGPTFGFVRRVNTDRSSAWSAVTQSTTVPPASKMTPNSWTNFNMVFDPADGKLIVSGSFTDIGGSGIKYLAKWNGTEWAPYSVNHVVTAPVKDMDAYAGGLILTGNFTSYMGVGPAPADPQLNSTDVDEPDPPTEVTETYPDPTHPAAVTGTPVSGVMTLYGTLGLSQVMAGLRHHYARAFSKQIAQRILATGEVTQVYQSGINCCFRITEAASEIVFNTSLSPLLLKLETPTTFIPKMLSITGPSGLINIPTGSDLFISFWWKSGVLEEFSGFATALTSASFWAGSGTEAAGFKNICRIQITSENADTVIYQKIEGNVFSGGFGTMLVVPWLRMDRVPTMSPDDANVYGVGSLLVNTATVDNEESGWNPIIRLHG